MNELHIKGLLTSDMVVDDVINVYLRILQLHSHCEEVTDIAHRVCFFRTEIAVKINL
jgi:hypothetical protein